MDTRKANTSKHANNIDRRIPACGSYFLMGTVLATDDLHDPGINFFHGQGQNPKISYSCCLVGFQQMAILPDDAQLQEDVRGSLRERW
jgi:hypothetical protein